MKIICIGRNYAAHAKELNNPIPAQPVVFMKPASALLINRKPFYFPEFTKDLHYEAEIVLKIGKNGRHVQPEFALDYIQEIGLGIDFTARDLQLELKAKGQPWELAKGFDGSAVIGDFVSLDTLPGLSNIEFYLEKNGERVQHGFSKDMLFSFQDIICFVSQYFKLQMGDYIYTGTPAGVGPVVVGDELRGFLMTKDGAKETLACNIR
ncbi:MAG: fumarylacetoacetate hydrolase family protein [Lewinella sp.]|jgi:2-keto-4-pentenoate hydratase/2-oxohepta-3-ene-1,7-dioic acid hydratase in catechol pathway|uniref:fumarylacetoacetate hydrolase family protein n=1 Tax=Lewinella sp. TaxID=2004506 RepID=UPI003D6B9602